MFKLDPAPVQVKDLTSPTWSKWFSKIQFNIGRGSIGIEGYAKAALPDATKLGSSSSPAFSSIIFVYDEVGGPTLAFSNGTNWLRVQDRAVVS